MFERMKARRKLRDAGYVLNRVAPSNYSVNRLADNKIVGWVCDREENGWWAFVRVDEAWDAFAAAKHVGDYENYHPFESRYPEEAPLPLWTLGDFTLLHNLQKRQDCPPL